MNFRTKYYNLHRRSCTLSPHVNLNGTCCQKAEKKLFQSSDKNHIDVPGSIGTRFFHISTKPILT